MIRIATLKEGYKVIKEGKNMGIFRTVKEMKQVLRDIIFQEYNENHNSKLVFTNSLKGQPPKSVYDIPLSAVITP
jgi:hypothetical protein